MTDFFLEFLSHWIWLSLGLALLVYSFKDDLPGEPKSRIIIVVLAILCFFGALTATVLDVYHKLTTVHHQMRESQGQKWDKNPPQSSNFHSILILIVVMFQQQPVRKVSRRLRPRSRTLDDVSHRSKKHPRRNPLPAHAGKRGFLVSAMRSISPKPHSHMLGPLTPF